MRNRPFGEDYELTFVDKAGIALSNRKIISFAKKNRPRCVIDIGCGYNAGILSKLSGYVERRIGVDIKLNKQLKGIELVEKTIGDDLSFLQSSTADLIILNSVLEHLANPSKILEEMNRVLRPGGTAFINVPSWIGKYFLELSAFRFHLSPKDEMDDHKMYYNKRDIWPLLVKAGFLPSQIKMRYHKFFLCTLCYAKK